ncbi:MAG: hypothetical protein MJZ36_03190 [Bacteroidaceae bacterium]|nr:hypothetical protein [Bacteroidaceae bacterium]
MKRVLIIFIISSLYACFAYSQEFKEYSAEYFNWIKEQSGKDSLPIIIYNDREISVEECAKIPIHKINTAEWIHHRAEELIGERGKRRDIIYLHEKPTHLPLLPPTDGRYYDDERTNFESEFPGGEDSLNVFIKNNIEIPEELHSIYGHVWVYYCTDEYGNREKVEPYEVIIAVPEMLRIPLRDGKRANKGLISDKGARIIDLMIETATKVANKFPQFKPGNIWLHDVPFKKKVRITFGTLNVRVRD